MNCDRCQHPNQAGAKFCEECGAPLARVCKQCGQSLSAKAKFCPECAHPTGAAAAAPPTGAVATAPPAARFDSPDAYTPRHLAEKILTSKAAIEGERKQVTVLFADLKGSTELLADRDPEEARDLLDPVLEHMMAAVHRYEGTVNQVMGDGIMAIFGAPLAHEDHAARACYAALDMQAAIRRFAEEVRRKHGFGGIASRVGLNSGEVVVRAISAGLRMDYSAVGLATHLAARMEQLATPDTTLLTPATFRLAEGHIAVQSLGPLPVKGLDAPLEVYQLIGAGERRSRIQATALRGLSRFVGRDTELEQLHRSLERAGGGRGQLVAIVGEPGLGKSRLVWDLTHSSQAEGWTVVQASALSYGKATSYLPVIGLLKTYFRLEDRDDHRKVREKVIDRLLALDGALEATLPALLALLDVPVDDAAWRALDPPQRRHQTLGALKRLLLRESQLQPLLVVFEDLHWIDSETQFLLDSLVESLPTARILLLVNYRPEYAHRWGGKSYYNQLRLDPLPPASAAALLRALLGPDSSLEPLTPLLIERTEGNPFFLEESVRDLVETRVLAGERGHYRLASPLPGVQVPATVQAVLAARLDRLPADEKRVLQEAGVIGKDVPIELLRAVTELTEAALPSHLAHLQAAEFLYETSVFPDVEYTFKHALTHEVAYGSVLHERRRALHARVVDAIERRYADRLAEQAEQLAHHAFRGKEWVKAVTYFRQAGTKAAMRSAHREAAASFEQALTALAQLPQSRETLEQAVDVRLDLRNALYPLNEIDRILAVLREAESFAAALDDRRRGWVATYLGTHFFGISDLESAITSGRRALDLAASVDDVALEVQASSRLGWVYNARGDHGAAVELLDRSLRPLVGEMATQRLGMPTLPAVMSRAYLTWSFSELGRFTEGAERAKEALRLAEGVGEMFSRMVAYTSLGGLRRCKGELDEALPLLERACALCREANIVVWSKITDSELGYAYTLAGRSKEALELLEASTHDVVGDPRLAQWLGWRGETYLLAGRWDDAERTAEQAIQVARASGARGFEAWGLHLLGDVLARRDRLDAEAAEAHYQGASALAGELGMRPLMARCHLGRGKLRRRLGDPAGAEEHLTLAAAMFREMDMGLWLSQAEAALRPAPSEG